MPYLILIATGIFLFSAFLGSLPVSIPNAFVAYVFFQVNFILHYFIYFLIGSLFVFLFFVQKKNTYIRSFFQTIFLYIVSIFFAFAILFLVALIQLNSFALLANTYPRLLGITSDPSTIYILLKQHNSPPKIIPTEKNPQQEAIGIAQAITGTTNLYGSVMLSAVPNFLILPVTSVSSSLILIDNTLVVTDIRAKDLQTISPLLGYLFVQKYFSTQRIKSFPKVTVMDTHEYLSYRKNDAKGKLEKAGIEVQKMTDSIATISAEIQKDTDNIATNATSQQDALKKQNTQYDTCLSTGNYVSGVFHPQYTKDDCQKILDLWESTISSLGKDEDGLKQQLQKDQELFKQYQYYKDFFGAQKTLIAVSSNNIPSELGVFIPPDSLKVVVDSSNSHSIGDFFETLCHEYLHYASAVSGKRLDSSFFEEGLTEYFARQVIQDAMQIDTNIGYPVAVKIISTLTNRISSSDLADIYFSKNQLALEKTLNLAYGDNFYKDNITLFESLQYTSDPEQALQLANTIMKKIDGKPLTEKDFFSKESNL